MPSLRPFAYLQCVYRRLARLFSAIALAEKGCFDEVRELLHEPTSTPGQSEVVGASHSHYS